MLTSNLCGWARILAHAKSREAPVIGGYRSKSDGMDNTVAGFAAVCAGKTDSDYAHPRHDSRGEADSSGERISAPTLSVRQNEFRRISIQ